MQEGHKRQQLLANRFFFYSVPKIQKRRLHCSKSSKVRELWQHVMAESQQPAKVALSTAAEICLPPTLCLNFDHPNKDKVVEQHS